MVDAEPSMIRIHPQPLPVPKTKSAPAAPAVLPEIKPIWPKPKKEINITPVKPAARPVGPDAPI